MTGTWYSRMWSTQIACRVALLKKPVYGRVAVREADDDGGEPTLKAWRRWMKVVFAPHVAASAQGVDRALEFEVTMGGLKTLRPITRSDEDSREG